MLTPDEMFGEIRRLLDEYHQRITEGTKNPNNFLKLDDIESMLDTLCKSTENIYLRDTISLLESIDEKELIASKKENTSPKELN